MIGALRGRLAAKDPDRVLVETGGIGWLVHVPLSTSIELPAVGAEALLHVHTHVREDAIQLFGFLSEGELRLFERLIGVSGIGPRMALNVLSGIAAPELARAISSGDIRRLCSIPGLGKKTSERLVVELRDKLADLHLGPDVPRKPSAADSVREDALSALVNLGYRRKDAEAAIERAAERGPVEFEPLLKAALALLAK